MDALLVLLLLYLALVLLVIPIWAIVKIRRHDAENEYLQLRLEDLEREIRRLNAPPAATVREVATPIRPTAVSPPIAPVASAPVREPVVSHPVEPEPPVLPPVIARTAIETPAPVELEPQPQKSAIDWEQFMGAKLFAWLGGLALFLGVAFFVKYSFEHDWIPPEVRVAFGFLLGAGLIIGGLRLDQVRYRITSQTLLGAGVVSLYAVTFACNSIYHFSFFGPLPTFLLMVLITATAFLLAVRLQAQVVALLGMLGGFLTPVLLSTGQDNPVGLFGYLALLDLGLIAVALRTRWLHLVPLSAGGTVLMMFGWADRFLSVDNGPVAMVVCLVFSGLYFAATELARRREISGAELTLSAVALPVVGLGFAFIFLGYPGIAGRVPLFLGYVLLLDVCQLALTWREESLPRLHFAAGMAVFVLLAAWSYSFVDTAALPWALAGYLGFAGLHTVFPEVLTRRRPSSAPAWWSQIFPPLALLLVLLPLYQLDDVSWLLWPAVLLIDVLAIGLALATASMLGVAAVLVLTLTATGVFVFKVPAGALVDSAPLIVIGGFAVFFFAASWWAMRRLGGRVIAGADERFQGILGDARAQLPAFSSLLPFLLLIMICARLAVPDPTMIFGLALLLVVLTLGLAQILAVAWLPVCALAGVTALEWAWHARHFNPEQAGLPLIWYFVFYSVFTLFPFVFQRTFSGTTGPWAVAALSGVAHFPLVYRVLDKAGEHGGNGLLPALFAVPPLLSLVFILRRTPDAGPARLNQLAWFGGVTLLFITLIFPIQFERQWLTIGWALEGVALLWLFHRVPHPGLRIAGVVLLLVAFVRLAANSEVLTYASRGATPLLNWYLYAFGLVTVALFAGARLLAPPRERVLGLNIPPLLQTLGVILAFLLLNIEIADYFSPAGSSALTFQFSGNFARDMTYTIAWALFALALLGTGIWKQQRAARYAAIGLLSVVLLKLFFHDLARLEALYRIGALFAVAVVAIVASFAYQRFLPADERNQS